MNAAVAIPALASTGKFPLHHIENLRLDNGFMIVFHIVLGDFSFVDLFLLRQKGIRRREFQRFIAALEKLPDEVTEFEEGMWSDLIESMMVYSKDNLRFTLPCKTEIKA